MNAASAALMLTSLVLTGQGITFRDRAGVMEVTNLTHFVITPVRDNVWTFTGSGRPFTARWLRQGVVVNGNEVTGELVSFGEGPEQRFDLRSGTFGGNITADMDGPSGKMSLRGMSQFNIVSTDGATWRFDGAGAPYTINLPEARMSLSAQTFRGTATRLTGTDSESIRWETLEVRGNVRGTMRRTTREGQEWNLTITAPTVSLNRANQQIVLTGGVTIDGDHPALGPGGGEMRAGRAVVSFADGWEASPTKFEAFEG